VELVVLTGLSQIVELIELILIMAIKDLTLIVVE
jgi:hypothetical protein